ncbi:MAG: GNAT family N-acetyltransferase [Deltaproteobacteria bacterium]|nr:GNAT family N-acetyltransferase [Deltaproteobacteria bacterium]
MDTISKGKIRCKKSFRGLNNFLRMTIQPLLPATIDDIVRIEKSSFSKAWTREDYLFFLNHACGVSFGVFNSHGQLCSFIISLLVQGHMDIISLATHPQYRRQGLAKLLLSHIEKCPGVRKIFLEVEMDNSPALSLYQQTGFSISGVRKRYYGGQKDAYAMMKAMNAQ